MLSDPAVADKIIKVLEGGEKMDTTNQAAGQMPPAGTPGAMPPGTAPPPAGQQLSPEVLSRLAQIEQAMTAVNNTLGEYRLDKELADMRGKYGQLRNHFGEALPEDFGAIERTALEKYRDLIENKLPMHEVALHMAAMEKALADNTPLRDRLIAAAAQKAQSAGPPPTPQGRSGGIPAAGEAGPQVYSTSADRMGALRELWRSLQSQNAGV